jgi:hypothetical protein
MKPETNKTKTDAEQLQNDNAFTSYQDFSVDDCIDCGGIFFIGFDFDYSV